MKPGPDQHPADEQAELKSQILRSLRWPLRLTRAGILAERLSLNFWPVSTLLLALGTVVGFGVPNLLGTSALIALFVASILALVVLLLRGFSRFRWPSPTDALERLDRATQERPLSAIWDHLTIGRNDPETLGLWQAHIRQMAKRARQMPPVRPDLRVSSRDRFGLRYLALTGFVTALVFGFQSGSDGFGRIPWPQGQIAQAAAPGFEGWIRPPRYTRLPVIYLNSAKNDGAVANLSVPQGSKVVFRLYGGHGRVRLEETVSRQKKNSAPRDKDAGKRADPQTGGRSFLVQKSGEIGLSGPAIKARWNIRMIPDLPPLIALDGPVERGVNGQTRLPFAAADDYGVVGGTVTITLDLAAVDRRYGLAAKPEIRPAITLDLPLPLRGDTRKFKDILIEDLSQSPWAGLPVILTLKATDALGQTRVSEEEQITLPGRHFFDPLAAALVEQRRDLLWTRRNAPRVAQVLRAISNRPADIFPDARTSMMVHVAIRRLELNTAPTLTDPILTDVVRTDVSDLLWHTATLIEDGDLNDAKAQLRRAQDRLSEALKSGASTDEIARLTEKLSRAMRDYMRQMAQQDRNGRTSSKAPNGPTRQITSDQLQQMLKRIEELARQGRKAEAQRLLEQLRQMMNNLRVARGGQGQGQTGQAMRGLRDTLRQQRNLSDDAFGQMQRQFNTPGQQRGGGATSPADLAQRQDALRQMLRQQRNGLPTDDSKAGKAARQALREAERQMEQARDALKKGNLPGAIDKQSAALNALRKGLRKLDRAVAGSRNKSTGPSGRRADSLRDPLGRRTGSAGQVGTNRTLLSSREQQRRARELMDEIRKRTGDKRRPHYELDYLNRLLDRF